MKLPYILAELPGCSLCLRFSYWKVNFKITSPVLTLSSHPVSMLKYTPIFDYIGPP